MFPFFQGYRLPFHWGWQPLFFRREKIPFLLEIARKIHSIRPESEFSSKNKQSFPHWLYEEFFEEMLKSVLKVFKTL